MWETSKRNWSHQPASQQPIWRALHRRAICSNAKRLPSLQRNYTSLWRAFQSSVIAFWIELEVPEPPKLSQELSAQAGANAGPSALARVPGAPELRGRALRSWRGVPTHRARPRCFDVRLDGGVAVVSSVRCFWFLRPRLTSFELTHVVTSRLGVPASPSP